MMRRNYMIGKQIAQWVMREPKPDTKDWREHALIDFFGLDRQPMLTAKDLMDEKSLYKKWIEYQEWKERISAYERFTGKKWRG
jgi:hypothetical protein